METLIKRKEELLGIEIKQDEAAQEEANKEKEAYAKTIVKLTAKAGEQVQEVGVQVRLEKKSGDILEGMTEARTKELEVQKVLPTLMEIELTLLQDKAKLDDDNTKLTAEQRTKLEDTLKQYNYIYDYALKINQEKQQQVALEGYVTQATQDYANAIAAAVQAVERSSQMLTDSMDKIGEELNKVELLGADKQNALGGIDAALEGILQFVEPKYRPEVAGLIKARLRVRQTQADLKTFGQEAPLLAKQKEESVAAAAARVQEAKAQYQKLKEWQGGAIDPLYSGSGVPPIANPNVGTSVNDGLPPISLVDPVQGFAGDWSTVAGGVSVKEWAAIQGNLKTLYNGKYGDKLCAATVAEHYRRLGVPVPTDITTTEGLMTWTKNHMNPKTISNEADLLPGDQVYMTPPTLKNSPSGHVGTYIGNGMIMDQYGTTSKVHGFITGLRPTTGFKGGAFATNAVPPTGLGLEDTTPEQQKALAELASDPRVGALLDYAATLMPGAAAGNREDLLKYQQLKKNFGASGMSALLPGVSFASTESGQLENALKLMGSFYDGVVEEGSAIEASGIQMNTQFKSNLDNILGLNKMIMAAGVTIPNKEFTGDDAAKMSKELNAMASALGVDPNDQQFISDPSASLGAMLDQIKADAEASGLPLTGSSQARFNSIRESVKVYTPWLQQYLSKGKGVPVDVFTSEATRLLDDATAIKDADTQEGLANIGAATAGVAGGLQGQQGQINDALTNLVAAISGGATEIRGAASSLASSMTSAGSSISGQIQAAIQASFGGQAPPAQTPAATDTGTLGTNPAGAGNSGVPKLSSSAGGLFANATVGVYRRQGTKAASG
jgi:hypothetical protein